LGNANLPDARPDDLPLGNTVTGSAGWRGTELRRRALSGVVLIGISLFGLWQGGLVYTIIVALFAAAGLTEWLRLFRPSHGQILEYVGVVALCTALLSAFCTSPAIAAWIMLGLLPLFGLLAAWLAGWRQAGWLTLGLAYVGYGCWALLALRLLPEHVNHMKVMTAATDGMKICVDEYHHTDVGLWWMLYLFLVVWGTDIGAYFSGRLIGGAKLCPAISPSKTWAGLGGGMLLATALVWSLALWHPVPRFAAMLGLAPLLAIVAQAGDLFESWIKRRCGAKDSGTLIPGHGGVLDRIDGLVFAALVLAGLQAIAGEWMQWW
jgi:phosphatidate cytidylyltransferase